MEKYIKLCKKDCFNFCSPYGLGDTLMLCGLKDVFEEVHKEKIHFIIKPAHEYIMKMYEHTNYTLVDINPEELKQYIPCNEHPQIGKLYIAHMAYNRRGQKLLKSNYNFLQLYNAFLELDINTKLSPTKVVPKLSTKTEMELRKFAPLDKIVLIAPNAKSVPNFIDDFWLGIVQQWNAKGYTVLVNDEMGIYKLNGTHNINYSISDTVAIGLLCYKVFSIRNGLCDILSQYNLNLTIYYPSQNLYNGCSAKKLYNNDNIEETVITKEYIRIDPSKTIFEKLGFTIKHFMQNIFSVKNEYRHKVLRVFGIKIKMSRKNYKYSPL